MVAPTVSSRIEASADAIENSAVVAEKFSDFNNTTPIATSAGTKKPLGQLQKEAEDGVTQLAADIAVKMAAADVEIARIATFSKETFTSGNVYTETKIYFIDSNILYTPVLVPFTASALIQTDIDSGALTVHQGLTINDLGRKGAEIVKAQDAVLALADLSALISEDLEVGQTVKALATAETYQVVVGLTGQTGSGRYHDMANGKQLKLEVVGQADDIAELRLFKPTYHGQEVDLLGHTLPGIGGGPWFADFYDTSSDDNDGTQVISVNGIRMKRHIDSSVTSAMFGAIGDGVVDDTAAIIKTFAYANSVGVKVTSRFGAVLRLTGAASLVLNTSADFQGSVFDMSEFTGTLMISSAAEWVAHDSASAVVTSLTGTLSGSVFAGWNGNSDLYDSFIKINTTQDFYQYRGAVIKRTEFNKSVRSGRLESALYYPLDANAVDNVEVLSISKEMSTVENLTIRLGSNDAIAEVVAVRNATLKTVKNVRFELDDVVLTSNPSYFSIKGSCHINVEDIYLQRANESTGETGYTYLLNIDGCYDVYLKNVHGTGEGWGATGANESQKITFERCSLSRIDFHTPVREYIKVIDCDLGDKVLTVSVIGDMYLIRTTFTLGISQSGIVQIRTDCGGFCDGDLIMRDCKLNALDGQTLALVLSGDSSSEPKPVGSPINYTAFREILVENLSTGENIGYVNMVANIVGTNVTYPRKSIFRDCLNGNFRVHMDISSNSPDTPSVDANQQLKSNLKLMLDNFSLLEGNPLSILDLTANNFSVDITFNNLFGRDDEPASFELICGGVAKINNSHIEALDFYSGGWNSKILDVQVNGGVFDYRARYNVRPINATLTGAALTKVGIVNAKLITAADDTLRQFAFAKLRNCTFSNSTSNSSATRLALVNEDLQAVSGDLFLSHDSLNKDNEYKLLVGLSSNNNAQAYSFNMPDLNEIATIPTADGYITVTRSGALKLTLTQTTSAEILRYIVMV